MVAFEGFLNCTIAVTAWLGARLAVGNVRYGVPAKLPVAFTIVK